MFGTLILTSLLISKGGKSLLRTRLSLISDNQGNIFALLNQKTKRMPTSAFLMQLVLLLHEAGVQLAPSHMKRDLNSINGRMNSLILGMWASLLSGN